MIKIPHDKFCILPWVSLESSPSGTVRPCCLAIDEIVDDEGKKFQLVDASFDKIRDSQYMRDLRTQFIEGKQPQTCTRCWKEERSGRTSKRMHTLNRLKHMITDAHWDEKSKPLIFLDLKLGNICNLKCRICGSWSSSTYATEELQFVSRDNKKDNYHYKLLRAGAWPRTAESFWEEIDQHITDIRYIEFTGGEPFMIQEHFDMLKGIVDRGIAHNVEIHYNTNGTQWPEGAEEIWQHFKTVEIAFSIDDLEQRFEYQRTNAVWSEVNENINRFRDLRQRHKNIELQVCSTVSVFNVFYLEKLASWIDRQGFNFIYWNMMHEPYYFSTGTMPDKAKQQAIRRLENADVGDFHRQEFDRIIEFIRNGVSLDGQILRMSIADLDWRRNQDLRDAHPDLAEALDYHGHQR